MAVYFIKSGEFVKIGKTRDPRQRLRELQTGNPQRLRILCVVPGGEEVEKEIHRKFNHLRQGGEWFTHAQEIDDMIAQLTAAFDGYVPPMSSRVQKKAKRKKGGKFRTVYTDENDRRLECNSDGYYRWRWQVKDENGNPVVSPSGTYKRGSEYVGSLTDEELKIIIRKS
jgi:hypothetical protein